MNRITATELAELEALLAEGCPMTVIAAMQETDSTLLLAGDRGGKETPGIWTQFPCKLTERPNTSLAFGWAGNPTLAEAFQSWFLASQALTWEDFIVDAVEQLAGINGNARRLVTKAGVKPTNDHVVTVLVVGWLDGVPNIIEIDNEGQWFSYLQQGFQAIGSGKLAVQFGYDALKEVDFQPSHFKMLRIMEVAAMRMPDCGVPIDIWRLPKDGKIEVLSK